MATIQETLWNRITAYIGGSGTAPTLSMYSAAGISGVTTQTLAWVNASISGMTLSGESAADKAALSAISASAAKLLNLANGSAPDMAANALDEFDFANLRITVCASDLALINSALGAQTNAQVHSKASVQALVDAAQDVQRVIAGVPAATLTASDFAAIGISGVSADNLHLAADALSAHGGGKTTVAELQTIVTDANTPMAKFMSDAASTPPQAVAALNTSLALNGPEQAEQRFDLELPSMLVAADNEPDPEHKNSLASPLMALGRILWGDGSGYGNTGIAGLPYDGGGDDDELQGTEAADIIFGDGSGGGAMNGTSAGKAGSGNDRLSGGAGNDLLFGDGFAGAGELGGYGGGGGGDLTWYGDDGQGGIGAGVGMGRVTTNVSPSWLGRLNQNTRTQAQLLGVAEDNWVGGAGVRNGNINQGAQTDTVSHDLNDAAAVRVSRYGGRSVYDKVLWDLSGGTSGFGVGNTTTDAAGIGSGGTQVDGRAYAQQRGTGNDVLRGGKGADWLMGGGGADMFVWTGDDMDGSSDYIVDFNAKEGDRIWLDAALLKGWSSGRDLSPWVRVETGLTQGSPFEGGQGVYSRISIDRDGAGRFDAPEQRIYLRGDAMAHARLLDAVQVVEDAEAVNPSQVLSARWSTFDWSVDYGVRGRLDGGDVVRLTFDEAVQLSGAALAAAFGAGASARAVYPSKAGLSTAWDVRLGSGAALAPGVVLTLDNVHNAGDAAGSLSYVVAAGDIAAPRIKPFSATELDEGVQFYGWATAGATMRLSWGGTTADFKADSDGFWSYTFYGNESLYGHRIPAAGKELPVALYAVGSGGATTLLWQQTAAVDITPPELLGLQVAGGATALAPGQTVEVELRFSETPQDGFGLSAFQVSGGTLSHLMGSGTRWTMRFTAADEVALARIALMPGALSDGAGNANTQWAALSLPVASTSAPGPVRPLSQNVVFRSGQTAVLDLRDPALDMAGTDWRVVLTGLDADLKLNHGVRSAWDGSWTVRGQDLADLRILSEKAPSLVQSEVVLRYEHWNGQAWTPRSTAAVSVQALAWRDVAPEQSIEDFKNFTRVREAWNQGSAGLSGKGVTVEAEGGVIVPGNHSFQEGNVLPGSATGASENHGTGVGMRIAGGWDRGFVGAAYGARIGWGMSDTDIDNNSWHWGYGAFWSQAAPRDMPNIVNGRGGLGQVVVFSAGNGGPLTNTSLIASTKSPAHVAVASIDNASGQVAGFSTWGDALTVAAPGWGGTSHAAPHVAGIVALMLEAAPGLGFRDVQAILAHAATYQPVSNPYANTALNAASTHNGAGLHYSRQVGFGVLDAYNATRLAADWLRSGMGPRTITGWTHETAIGSGELVVSAKANEVTRWQFTVVDDVAVESVQLDAFYRDPAFSKLAIKLISPSGTQSILATGDTPDGGARTESILATSRRFAGESSRGTWTVELSHSVDVAQAAAVTLGKLLYYGDANPADQRYVFTDELSATYAHLASARDRARMHWINDRDGNDALMGSALGGDLQVHLGREGWARIGDFPVLMTPGTRLESAFGGDGNDVLVGSGQHATLLVGNAGNDVLMGHGHSSRLDGGAGDDWLWLGGDTVATGGLGTDRFLVFGGEQTLTSSAAVLSRMGDFDARTDTLFSYDVQGQFKVARFSADGVLKDWIPVTDSSLKAQLGNQWQQAEGPTLLKATIQNAELRLLFDQDVSYSSWDLHRYSVDGVSPTGSGATAYSLSLSAATPLTTTSVVHVAPSTVTSTLGRSLSYEWIYVGNGTDNVLDASDKSQPTALFGNGGNDQMRGGGGDDLLVAGAGGSASMTGGAGSDVFRLGALGSSPTSCRITDFNLQEKDRLSVDETLLDIGPTAFIEDLLSLVRRGDDGVLTINTYGTPYAARAGMEVVLEGLYRTNAQCSLLQLFEGRTVIAA